MATEMLGAIVSAMTSYLPPGSDARSKEWGFVFDLARQAYERFAPYHLDYVMGLLSEVSLKGAYLNGPNAICTGNLHSVDPLQALDQVIFGLMKVPSPQFIGEHWNINRPMLAPGRPNVAYARANVLYRWGPPQADRRFNSSQLFLEMSAEQGANLVLTLRFQDQLAWLFDESVHQINTAARAIDATLREYGSLSGTVAFAGSIPVGQQAVEHLVASGAPFIAR
jgi:hypothetical protein